ncbi:MAG TPA: AMP-binding protein [Rhodanobacteraceae bacterium]
MSAITQRPDSSSSATLPLLADAAARRVVAWRHGAPVRVDAFLADVMSTAARLPAAPAVVNLCVDRYAFLVAFCAALVAGQTNLLPPSRAEQAVRDVMAAHPGCYALGDQADVGGIAPYLALPSLTGTTATTTAVPTIAADHVAAIGYTSGSTGKPVANAKTWGSFAASSAGNLGMLRAHLDEPFHVLATVPPQHMYGMELSVLLPLFGHAGVHAGRPLLPADVARELAELPAPRVLATTPVHLRALVKSGQAMPPLAALVSATAPLPRELARAAEDAFGAPMLEMFGSTETCVFASRRTAREDVWATYPGVHVEPHARGTTVMAPQLAAPVELADIFEPAPGGFYLRGRGRDMLDMAGKRASLADLNQRLLAIDGVVDGVIFQPDAVDALGVQRLAALVVAPDLDAAAIRAALARVVDPVFLPRPLHKVNALPRNATGKLPRQALQDLLQRGAG